MTEQDIIILLLEQDIDPNGTVTGKDDMLPLKKAVYHQLPFMLAGMKKSESEGGYSITWDLDGIKMWYSALARELGLPDTLVPKPTVTGKKPW